MLILREIVRKEYKKPPLFHVKYVSVGHLYPGQGDKSEGYPYRNDQDWLKRVMVRKEDDQGNVSTCVGGVQSDKAPLADAYTRAGAAGAGLKPSRRRGQGCFGEGSLAGGNPFKRVIPQSPLPNFKSCQPGVRGVPKEGVFCAALFLSTR